MKVKDITSRDIWAARKRIAPYITRTPLVYSPELSEKTGANIYLKLENLQAIGAFKVRGAANKILSLTPEERANGVSTFSTGNHGMAVAHIASRLGVKATVCMSRNVPQAKVKAISRWNPEILMNWDSQDAAGVYCYELEKEKGVKVIPVTLGLKMSVPDVKIIGVSQERAAVMIESLKAGHPIEMPEEPTLADSLLGGIGLDNQYTYDIVKDYVDETVQVSEEEIANGMAYIMENHKVIAEGASCVGIAYCMREGVIKPGSNVAIIVTGCGVPMEQIKEIVNTNF